MSDKSNAPAETMPTAAAAGVASCSSGSSSSSGCPRPSRIQLSDTELGSLPPSELAKRWRELDSFALGLEHRLAQQEGEIAGVRDSEERLKQLHAESQQREKVLVRRLAAKEQEMQDLMCQISELKSGQVPSSASLRSALLDPAVNLMLQSLRRELTTTKTKLEETQNELSAWKFTPDSNTGKRLMAKCRLLHQENEELGKAVSSGRIAKLEGELALQKSFGEEMKKSQLELDEFLQELDEDVEGMQSTIYLLQQELRKSKEAAAQLQAENSQLRSARVNGTQQEDNNNAADGKKNSSSSGECAKDKRRTRGFDHDDDDDEANISDDGNAPAAATAEASAAAAADSPSPSGNNNGNDAARSVKKVRRSSVLSLDINDDDALVISTNGDATISDDAD